MDPCLGKWQKMRTTRQIKNFKMIEHKKIKVEKRKQNTNNVSSNSSTSSAGGNHVDGLPPASSVTTGMGRRPMAPWWSWIATETPRRVHRCKPHLRKYILKLNSACFLNEMWLRKSNIGRNQDWRIGIRRCSTYKHVCSIWMSLKTMNKNKMSGVKRVTSKKINGPT